MKQKEVIAIGMTAAFILAAAIVVIPVEAASFATSQVKDCANGDSPTDTLCENTSSQVGCILLCFERVTEAPP
jgi:hypothetical protein